MRRILMGMTAALLAVGVAIAPVSANVGIDSGTNAFRVANGRRALPTSGAVTTVAMIRVHDIDTDATFGHNVARLSALLKSYLGCWQWWGENIAWATTMAGFSTPQHFVTAWEDSPEHRDNMLNPVWTMQGSAMLAAPNGKTYAVQIFVQACAPAPKPQPTVRPTPRPLPPAPIVTPRPTPRPTTKPTAKPKPKPMPYYERLEEMVVALRHRLGEGGFI